MAGILVLVYTVAVFVIYHKIFDVYYFGGAGKGIMKELIGSFLAGLMLTALTLYYWWIADIIIILVGLGFAGKSENPQTKKVILGAFVVLAIVVAVLGIGYKSGTEETEGEEYSTGSVQSITITGETRLSVELDVQDLLKDYGAMYMA